MASTSVRSKYGNVSGMQIISHKVIRFSGIRLFLLHPYRVNETQILRFNK